MHIELDTNAIKAAALCAATKDARYYLKGVHVRVTHGELYIESTNGAIVFLTKMPAPTIDDMSVIIPIEIVKAALKIVKKSWLSLKIEGDDCSLLDIPFAPVEGRFPNINQVVPPRDVVSCEADIDYRYVQFDPDLLVRCRDALNTALGLKKPAYKLLFPKTNTQNSASLMVCDDLYPLCVVMSRGKP